MSLEMAELVWLGVAAYLGAGVLVALFTSFIGLRLLDHAGDGASLAFRLVALPGFAVMWPALVIRYLSGRKINADPNAGRGDAS